MGPQGAQQPFLYEVSIVVLIDFIATLLTPGIFSIQIVNTNMYLIHFYSKNTIKMHFPKSWVLKFQNRIRLSKLHYTSLRDGINCVGRRKAFLVKLESPTFKSEQLNILILHIIYIYI